MNKGAILMATLLAALPLAAENNPVVAQGADYPCVRAAAPVKLEGKLENWRKLGAQSLFLSGFNHAVMPDWQGPEDVAVTVWLLHDEGNLYFASLVRDRHPYRQEKSAALYRGSGFQLAFDPLDDTLLPGYDGNDIEIGLGMLAGGRAAAHCWSGGEALQPGELKEVEVRVTELGDNQFFYEARIPWQALAPFDPANRNSFGFNVLYNANKNGERRGWLHWTPGIGEEKLAFLFRNVRLCAAGEGGAEALVTTDRRQYQSGDAAKIIAYLPTLKAGEGQVMMTVTDAEGKSVHREERRFQAEPGGSEVVIPYEIGRLRGAGLAVALSASWPGGGAELRTEILNLSIPMLQARSAELAARIQELRGALKAAEVPVDYPLVAAAVAEATLRHRDADLAKPERVAQFALLPRIHRQFLELDAMLTRAGKELESLQKGELPRRPVPKPAMANLTIREGAFYSGDQPVILIGPHGWWQVYPDIDLISEIGFNLIGGTLIAGDATPAPGKTRLDYGRTIVKHLKTMRKYNIAYDFLISPHPLPKGWTEAHPEMKEYPASGWINSSLYIDATRRMVDEMWKVLIPMTAAEPNLVSFNLVNEWSFGDGIRHFHPKLVARFREAMAKKYGEIAALNRKWRSNYASFDELDPAKLKRGAPGAFYDWEAFRHAEGLENVEFLRASTRRYTADKPLQIKTIAVTDISGESYTPVGVEREERGELMDLAGSDCASTLHLDYYRSLVPDKPATDTEFHVSANTTPEEIVADNWSAILHGEGMRQYFAWSTSYSAENLAAGAVLHIPAALEALGRSTLDIRRLVPEIVLFQQAIPRAEVGILYSPASKYCDPAWPARLRQCHALLSNQDAQIRFVSERQLAAGKTGELKVIVIPGGRYLLPETVAALNQFIAAGNRVYRVNGAATLDPYGDPLSELRGARSIELTPESLAGIWETVKRPLRLEEGSGSIELRFVQSGNRTLFYLINYGAPAKVQPVLNGRKLAGAMELIAGEKVAFPLELPNRKPLMFEVKP